jgi:O-antigen ligase
MGRLALLFVFYWVLLLENGPGVVLPLIDLGNGLEIRPSLVLKLLFLLINIAIWVHFIEKYSIPRFFLIMGAFLVLSTGYVLVINPDGILPALSVNLHILLMFNIVLFIRYNTHSLNEIETLLNGLRLFALINAILVLASYFFPESASFFESGISRTGVNRAFGIMGDEVSVFLTFFLYDALVSRRYPQALIHALAIVFTAGLGATLTAVLLLLYHLAFVMRRTRLNLYLTATIGIPVLLLVAVLMVSFRDSGVVKRVSDTVTNTREESAGLRILSLSVAMEMIRERPVLGYGFGNYRAAVIDEYEPRFREVDRLSFFRGSAKVILTSAFNPFVQMLAEAGIIGLGFFIWFLVKLYGYTRINHPQSNERIRMINQNSRSWLLVFLISTLSANWFLPSSFLFLLVVTLLGINYKLKELDLDGTTEETV